MPHVSDLTPLENPIEVTLSDGRKQMATGRGTVKLQVKLPPLKKKLLNLNDTLMVPELTYNLLSVSKAVENGKITVFNKTHCEIQEDKGNVVAFAEKVGSLYRLHMRKEGAFMVQSSDSTADLWHKRYGHLSFTSMNKLAGEDLVTDFDYKENNSNGL